MQRVIFSITEWTGNLVSRLDWVTSPSRKLTEWPDWTFCPVVLQLAWRFSFSACFTRVHLLAACKPRATREIQLQVLASLHNFEHFFTLSHTLPLHDSHLNTKLLIAKIQTNLTRNKANKMVDWIQPYNFDTMQSLFFFFFFLLFLFPFFFFFFVFVGVVLAFSYSTCYGMYNS